MGWLHLNHFCKFNLEANDCLERFVRYVIYGGQCSRFLRQGFAGDFGEHLQFQNQQIF